MCPPFNGHLPRARCQICDLIAKVRADERERHTVNNPMLLADLRAEVEALYDQGRTRDWDYFAALDAVVALIDGNSDGA